MRYNSGAAVLVFVVEGNRALYDRALVPILKVGEDRHVNMPEVRIVLLLYILDIVWVCYQASVLVRPQANRIEPNTSNFDG